MITIFFNFLRTIWDKRQLIAVMTKREIKAQYVGSFLSFFWTIIHPMVMITVFWFVFSIGFKSKPLNDVPFVVWLAAGMAPWYCFSDILGGATHTITANAHLIKKTLFHAQILPVIRLFSGLVTHAVFLVVLLGLIVLQQLPVSFFFLQFLYYTFCLCMLVIGLAWIVSALNVFARDVAQIVGVGLQVGFWGTPIFWDIQIMPATVQFWLKLNPMVYVVQGYRESFINFVPFWHHPLYTLYFWVLTILLCVTGIFVFSKLKPEFADVL